MIIGVMSDTHGFLTEMRQAANKMIEEFGVDLIIHLGDDATDADELMGIGVDVISVPGVFEDRYKDKNIPNRIIKSFEGITFLMTHTPTRDSHDLEGDIDPTEAAQGGEARVILCGHTHIPTITEKFGAIYINPGTLKPYDGRSAHQSFAIIELKKSLLHVRILELKGGVMQEKTFHL